MRDGRSGRGHAEDASRHPLATLGETMVFDDITGRGYRLIRCEESPGPWFALCEQGSRANCVVDTRRSPGPPRQSANAQPYIPGTAGRPLPEHYPPLRSPSSAEAYSHATQSRREALVEWSTKRLQQRTASRLRFAWKYRPNQRVAFFPNFHRRWPLSAHEASPAHGGCPQRPGSGLLGAGAGTGGRCPGVQRAHAPLLAPL